MSSELTGLTEHRKEDVEVILLIQFTIGRFHRDEEYILEWVYSAECKPEPFNSLIGTEFYLLHIVTAL